MCADGRDRGQISSQAEVSTRYFEIFLDFALSKKIKKSILTQRKFFQFVEARLNIGMPHKSPEAHLPN